MSVRSILHGITLLFCVVPPFLALPIVHGGYFSTRRVLLSLVLSMVAAAFWTLGHRSTKSVGFVFLAAVILSTAYFLADLKIPLPFVLLVWIAIWMTTTFCLFRNRYRRSAILSMSLVVLLLVLAAIETVLIFSQAPKPVADYRRKSLETPEGNASSQHIAVLASHRRYWPDGETIYDVRYGIDADANRVVPGRPEHGRSWVILGGSYAFGEGLNDTETISARLQGRFPDVRVFSLARRGRSTADSLRYLQAHLDEGPAPTLVIYFMIDDHIRRNACPDSLTAHAWGSKRPHYQLNDGQLVFLGRAGDTLSLIGRLNVNLHQRSQIWKRLFGNWKTSEKSIELTLALLKELDRTCRDHGARLVIVTLPTNKFPSEAFEAIRKGMAEANIENLDLETRLAEMPGDAKDKRMRYFIDGDPHPNARGAKLFADWVADFLRDDAQ